MVLTLVCGLSTLPSSAQAPDRNEIIRQARQHYYSLRGEGLMEFSCKVQVDSDAFYKSSGIKLDALATNQLLPMLEKTYFEVLVGPSGAPIVRHQSPVPPPNEEVAKRYSQTTSGLEAVLTGAIGIWSMFMMRPPLPDAISDYQLENKGDKYRLTYNVGSSYFVTALTNDYVVDEVRVTEHELEATVRPTFAGPKDGLVLAGYEYMQNSTVQPDKSQQFSVKIEYQEVQGLKLPSVMNIVEPLGAAKLEIHLMFNDCQAKKDVNLTAADQTSNARSANSRSTPKVAEEKKAGTESGADLARPETAQPGRSETKARLADNLEVISDTHGADFGPYLSRLLQSVRANWYKLIPDEARPPHLKKGKVSIELLIMPDGKITGVKISGPSGVVAFDRAAWGGVTASAPFQPLPGDFHGPYLALRFHFYYNPAPSDLD
jgi:TonB family protein